MYNCKPSYAVLNIKTFTFNPIQENTYVVSDETHEAVIIDCGAYYPEETRALANYITQEGLHPVAHLLTHAHFDHIFGAGFVHETYRLSARYNVGDDELFLHPDEQYQAIVHARYPRQTGPAGEHVGVSTRITFGTHAFTVIPCPGHTPGGVCYYCAEERILFSGDSLFQMSIGRTDFPGGSYRQLIESLSSLLASLPADVRIYPGHGPATLSGEERLNNPFIM